MQNFKFFNILWYLTKSTFFMQFHASAIRNNNNVQLIIIS